MDMILAQFGAKPANIIVPTMLFSLLAPGFLLDFDGLMPVFSKMPMHTFTEVAKHAIVFFLVYLILRKVFSDVY